MREQLTEFAKAVGVMERNILSRTALDRSSVSGLRQGRWIEGCPSGGVRPISRADVAKKMRAMLFKLIT